MDQYDKTFELLIEKLEQIKQAIELNQGYSEGTNTLLGHISYPDDKIIGDLV